MKKIIALIIIVIVGYLGLVYLNKDTSDPRNVQLGGYGGLTLNEARSLASERSVPLRVVEQDGEPFAVTTDYVPGRVNVEIEDGLVSGYTIE